MKLTPDFKRITRHPLFLVPQVLMLLAGAAVLISSTAHEIELGGIRPATLSIQVPDGSAITTPLSVHGMYPGVTVTQQVRVQGAQDKSYALALGGSNLQDYENGCMHSEALVDTSCGADAHQGELSSELVLSVRATSIDASLSCTAYGSTSQSLGTLKTFTTASAPAQIAGLVVPKNGAACVELSATLPPAAGNETQSDSSTFDLTWYAQQTAGPTGMIVIPYQGGNHKFDAKPGDLAYAGYDFTYVPGGSTLVDAGQGELTGSCKDRRAPTQTTVTVPMPNRLYSSPESNSQGWAPSGDQTSTLVYQGTFVLGNYCHGGTMVIGQGMGPFTAQVSANTGKLSFRWHYGDKQAATGGGSSWSATKAVAPDLLPLGWS